MAFKIRVADIARINKGFEVLTAQRNVLEDQVRVFNESLAAARAVLQASVEEFNEQLNAVRGVIEDVHSELVEEFDGRSDSWKDGDRATEVQSWIDEIDSFVQNLGDVDISMFPEEMEFENIIGDDPATEFDELDKEPVE
jgi:chromosome segregation ATPase